MIIEPLDQARGLLDGAAGVRNQSIRAACWLARLAFEDTVQQILDTQGIDTGDANMRTLLSCLEVALADDNPGVPARAEYTWAQLSKASHYHAYELSPTAIEARNLIESVASLREQMDGL